MSQRDRPAQTDKERRHALARLKEAVSSRSRPREEQEAAKDTPRKPVRRKTAKR
jgi:hypothetical protein